MDKYHIVIMIFLLAGMGITITRDPPQIALFYVMVGGVVAVILYNAVKTRRNAQEMRRKRWRSKK